MYHIQCVHWKGFGSARSADSDTINTIYLSLYTQTAVPKFPKPFEALIVAENISFMNIRVGTKYISVFKNVTNSLYILPINTEIGQYECLLGYAEHNPNHTILTWLRWT